MGLLKYKDFNKMRAQIKEQKLKEKEAIKYKAAYKENLSKYGVSDASELDEEQLTEFLDSMKNYKNKIK